MTGSPPFENLSPSSFSILLVMGVVSLVLSVGFYLRSRKVRTEIPMGLEVNIFSRTFNIFKPYEEHRRIYHSYLFFVFFSPLMAFSWAFIVVFVIFLQILEAGLLLQFVVFLLSLGLLMVSEAAEIYSAASSLVKAVKTRRPFGQGDMDVLTIVRRSLGRLTYYYLFLSITFIGLFFTLSLILPAIALVFSYFVGTIVELTIGWPFVAPFAAALPFALITVLVFFVGGKAKAAVLRLSFLSRPTYVCSSAGLKGIHDPFVLASHIDDEDPDSPP